MKSDTETNNITDTILTKTTDRRGFIKGMIRGIIGLGLGAAGIALFKRKGTRGTGTQSCINQSLCRSCPAVPECILPQAQSYRNAHRKLSPKKDVSGG